MKHHLWIVGMFKIKVVKDGLVIMIAGNLSIEVINKINFKTQ